MVKNRTDGNDRLRAEFYEQRFFPDEKIVRVEKIRTDRIRIDLDDGKQYDYDSRLKILMPVYAGHGESDDDAIIKEFVLNIFVEMKTRGVSQEDLADMTGISQATISRYTNGDSVPDLIALRKIARALGCSVSDLTGGDQRDNRHV